VAGAAAAVSLCLAGAPAGAHHSIQASHPPIITIDY
jgi:hypothetical protein